MRLFGGNGQDRMKVSLAGKFTDIAKITTGLQMVHGNIKASQKWREN